MAYIALKERPRVIGENSFEEIAFDKKKNPVLDSLDGELAAEKCFDCIIQMKHPSTGVYETVDRAPNYKPNFYISNSRFVLRHKTCSHASRSLIFTVASGVKHKGNVWGGHIRYEWLSCIEYCQKGKNISALLGYYPQLHLYYKDDDGNIFRVVVQFKKGTDVGHIVSRIVKKVCRYRLKAGFSKSDDETAFYNDNLQNLKIEKSAEKDKFASVVLPSFIPAPQNL